MQAHQLLEVEEDANPEAIKTAYREKAKVTHPDRGGDVEEFVRLQEAYDLLREQSRAVQSFRRAGRWEFFESWSTHEDLEPAWRLRLKDELSNGNGLENISTLAPNCPGIRIRTLPHPLGNRSNRSELDADLAGAFVFTLVCAATASLWIGFSEFSLLGNMILFLVMFLTLCLPSALAALAGAADIKNARGIYTGVVFTLAVAMSFGIAGANDVMRTIIDMFT